VPLFGFADSLDDDDIDADHWMTNWVK